MCVCSEDYKEMNFWGIYSTHSPCYVCAEYLRRSTLGEMIEQTLLGICVSMCAEYCKEMNSGVNEGTHTL